VTVLTRRQRYEAWRTAHIGERGPRRVLWRVGVALVGALLVVGGLALVPLPGPGWVIVFVGLGVLATEFAWAEHLLRRARGLANSGTAGLRRQSPLVRVAVAVGCVLVVIAVLVGCARIWGAPSWLPKGLPLVR
jgi:uncharacterized protein (TIGR02611 family)